MGDAEPLPDKRKAPAKTRSPFPLDDLFRLLEEERAPDGTGREEPVASFDNSVALGLALILIIIVLGIFGVPI